jgi:hypothetical protein
MESYSGTEPQVGEIRALRTFRIGPGGVLHPLFSDQPWRPGTNTAHCRVADAVGLDASDAGEHVAPEPNCTCGYYAYATESGALEYPNAKHVLAVVACWGHVIAGTRGLRAQHARVEAIWMSETVPATLAAMVASGYPDALVYADKADMLEAHPLTVLDCYETATPNERALRKVGLRIAVTVALALGLMSAHWLNTHSDVRWVWAAELAFFAGGFIVLQRRRTDLAARRRAVIFLAIALWLVAPYGGAAGTLLLRIPLLQMGALTIFQRRMLAREAGRFPAIIGRPAF